MRLPRDDRAELRDVIFIQLLEDRDFRKLLHSPLPRGLARRVSFSARPRSGSQPLQEVDHRLLVTWAQATEASNRLTRFAPVVRQRLDRRRLLDSPTRIEGQVWRADPVGALRVDDLVDSSLTSLIRWNGPPDVRPGLELTPRE